MSDTQAAIGGPKIDWKAKYHELEKFIMAMESATIILHDKHRGTSFCEHPRTCGGCHFWTGAAAACRDLRTGDKSVIRKAAKSIQKQSEPAKLEISEIKWEYEDQIPEMADSDFDQIYPSGKTDIVRMYPFVEDSVGNRIWIAKIDALIAELAKKPSVD